MSAAIQKWCSRSFNLGFPSLIKYSTNYSTKCAFLLPCFGILTVTFLLFRSIVSVLAKFLVSTKVLEWLTVSWRNSVLHVPPLSFNCVSLCKGFRMVDRLVEKPLIRRTFIRFLAIIYNLCVEFDLFFTIPRNVSL